MEPTDDIQQWVIDAIRHGPEAGDASMEVDVHLQRMYQTQTRFVFLFNRSRDGAGTIYIPGRWGTDADDKIAERDNRAAFEAAQAVAEETGTRSETTVMSQAYLNSIAEESVADLIGEIGQDRVRELLEEERNKSNTS